MKNRDLAKDYVHRAIIRLKALETLYLEKGYADVVRESQEVVELCLKALLRDNDIATPRIHDVSSIIEENKKSLSVLTEAELESICKISRTLRRDRELSFYGTEDLTPSEFYRKEDAIAAKDQANIVVAIVRKAVEK